MSRYRISPAARQDLKDIFSFVARDNPQAATRVLDRLYKTIHTIAGNPEIGTLRTDLAPNLRAISCGRPAMRYVIFYRLDDGRVDVVRVLDGARDLPVLFP